MILKIYPAPEEFSNRLGANRDKVVELDDIRRILELEEIVVMQASYNAAEEDAAAANNVWVHGNNALLYYKPRTSGKRVPSAMYNFGWQDRAILEDDDAPAGLLSEVIEVHEYLDYKITLKEAGVYFSEVLTP